VVWPPHIGRSEIRGSHGQIGPSSTMNTYGSEQSRSESTMADKIKDSVRD
jgi:hypothetical protein